MFSPHEGWLRALLQILGTIRTPELLQQMSFAPKFLRKGLSFLQQQVPSSAQFLLALLSKGHIVNQASPPGCR